ncbi:MAG: radical SAM protein [Deltaproteobacteria bacterium]|nr:MAG: radical SAM protein [Deltaproteobacteria bacterium]
MHVNRHEFAIKRLASGGLITNYYCTSRCRHCLYACSPNWEKKYIDLETTEKNLRKIKSLGCRSIHIGGGEPFLNPDGLKMVLETAESVGVRIEYVETNSSWFKDRGSACRILLSLKEKGLSTLLVSMSPFHNEHIPFWKVKGVMEACHVAGIGVFPWIREFYDEITGLGDETTHTLPEYEDRYGPDYMRRLPSRYWIHFGGRAVKTFVNVFGTRPLEEILSDGRRGCTELLDVSHFHFDLFGNYIPGLCAGLAIDGNDLGQPLSRQEYPILYTLFERGVAGLYELATEQYGFKAASGYMSKCHLCLEIRRYLALSVNIDSMELRPLPFYENI